MRQWTSNKLIVAILSLFGCGGGGGSGGGWGWGSCYFGIFVVVYVYIFIASVLKNISIEVSKNPNDLPRFQQINEKIDLFCLNILLINIYLIYTISSHLTDFFLFVLKVNRFKIISNFEGFKKIYINIKNKIKINCWRLFISLKVNLENIKNDKLTF